MKCREIKTSSDVSVEDFSRSRIKEGWAMNWVKQFFFLLNESELFSSVAAPLHLQRNRYTFHRSCNMTNVVWPRRLSLPPRPHSPRPLASPTEGDRKRGVERRVSSPHAITTCGTSRESSWRCRQHGRQPGGAGVTLAWSPAVKFTLIYHLSTSTEN